MRLVALWQHAVRWRRLTLTALVCAGVAAMPPPAPVMQPSESATTVTTPAPKTLDVQATSPVRVAPPAASAPIAQPIATTPSATRNATAPSRDPPGSGSASALRPSRELRVDELPPEREPTPEQIPLFRGKDPRLRPSGPAELLHRDDSDNHKNR